VCVCVRAGNAQQECHFRLDTPSRPLQLVQFDARAEICRHDQHVLKFHFFAAIPTWRTCGLAPRTRFEPSEQRALRLLAVLPSAPPSKQIAFLSFFTNTPPCGTFRFADEPGNGSSSSRAGSTTIHPLFGGGACRWPGCERVFDEFDDFYSHLHSDHINGDYSAAQARIQMEVVCQLHLQLQKERDRLQAMILHLNKKNEMLRATPAAALFGGSFLSQLPAIPPPPPPPPPPPAPSTQPPSSGSSGAQPGGSVTPVGPFDLIAGLRFPAELAADMVQGAFGGVRLTHPQHHVGLGGAAHHLHHHHGAQQQQQQQQPHPHHHHHHQPALHSLSPPGAGSLGAATGGNGGTKSSKGGGAVRPKYFSPQDSDELNYPDVQDDVHKNREFYRSHDVRPPFTYASLIRQAIIESPEKQLTLNEIYNWFQNTFCYFRRNAATWKNAVRHNLSLHKCFMRVENIKGAVWTVNEAEFCKRRPQKLGIMQFKFQQQQQHNQQQHHHHPSQQGGTGHQGSKKKQPSPAVTLASAGSSSSPPPHPGSPRAAAAIVASVASTLKPPPPPPPFFYKRFVALSYDLFLFCFCALHFSLPLSLSLSLCAKECARYFCLQTNDGITAAVEQ
uniref:Fork-head domain-containing protein n=1 Tax=Anopheles coluzzii TaxID=1518534 RepID=A0A6E8VE43_ANOCL